MGVGEAGRGTVSFADRISVDEPLPKHTDRIDTRPIESATSQPESTPSRPQKQTPLARKTPYKTPSKKSAKDLYYEGQLECDFKIADAIFRLADSINNMVEASVARDEKI